MYICPEPSPAHKLMKKEIPASTGFAILVFFLSIVACGHGKLQVKATETKDDPSVVIKEVEKIVYQEPDEVEEYIKYVFEEDADKAFLVLKGKGDGTCAENRGLKWDAQNHNSDGSTDIGIFQINTKWQKIQAKWLFNWKVNVQIAHQLFEESGKSFKLWTCGKVYGI